MNQIRARAGRIIGRDHTLGQTNCQDGYALLKGTEGEVSAFVCDGCGSSVHSEVGAALAAHFLASRGVELLRAGLTMQEASTCLYASLLDY